MGDIGGRYESVCTAQFHGDVRTVCSKFLAPDNLMSRDILYGDML